MKAKPTMPTLLSAPKLTTESGNELNELLRRRAYQLYEQRGREDGHELDDWLQAESEITQKNIKAVAA